MSENRPSRCAAWEYWYFIDTARRYNNTTIHVLRSCCTQWLAAATRTQITATPGELIRESSSHSSTIKIETSATPITLVTVLHNHFTPYTVGSALRGQPVPASGLFSSSWQHAVVYSDFVHVHTIYGGILCQGIQGIVSAQEMNPICASREEQGTAGHYALLRTTPKT